MSAALGRAGYAETRWYPIGSHYQHGFAATTRLERQASNPHSAERWSTFYPQAASLRWLTFAQTPTLPHPSPHRAFLIAFTDLPMPGGAAAPIWSEQTLMDGPGAPEHSSLGPAAEALRVTPEFRFGVYEYRYDWDEQQQRGRRVGATQDAKRAWPSALNSF